MYESLLSLSSPWETYVVSDECQRERSNPQSLRILRILRATKISSAMQASTSKACA